MADWTAFYNYLRDFIEQASWFSANGFARKRIYRQFLPQVKSPEFPCISTAMRPLKRDRATHFDALQLFITVHSDSNVAVEQATMDLADRLHGLHYSCPNFTLYNCWYDGSPPIPEFDKSLNKWYSLLEFELNLG